MFATGAPGELGTAAYHDGGGMDIGLLHAGPGAGLPVAGGDAGVAWLDAGVPPVPAVHVALPGVAPAPDRPLPAVHVGRPRRSVLAWDDPLLLLPMRCSAACAVRAQLQGARAAGSLALAHAGRGEVALLPRSLAPVAPAGGGRGRVRLLYGAPGACRPRSRTVTVRLRLHPVPATPHPSALRAVRDGAAVLVRWRSTGYSEPNIYFVTGAETRRGEPVAAVSFGRTGRRFTARLEHAREVRFVSLHLVTWRGMASAREVRVR